MAVTFTVARNPDEQSKLPYLVRIPVAGGPLVLKTREPWPRTSSVYCHRADGWPQEPDVIDRTPVIACERRGRAIDLVLDRPRENRSQFVFTTKAGRELIFWQTSRTTTGARPGVRLPSRRASGQEIFTIVVDTRERYAYQFKRQQAVVSREHLDAGDYAVLVGGDCVASVERKSVADLASSLVDGSLGFLGAALAALPHAAVVVDGRYRDVFEHEHVSGGFLADLLARFQVRYPAVPVVFCETRKLAEEWTYRFLGAARAEALGEAEWGDPTRAPEG